MYCLMIFCYWKARIDKSIKSIQKIVFLIIYLLMILNILNYRLCQLVVLVLYVVRRKELLPCFCMININIGSIWNV
uniref:Uncharacterized protein n=1 Tax=Physcomitrium patens TaxID=3218 RepID=A0A2K1KKJ7_PHYPA|nr:hypothetical protein PHYPA_007973 [Physcomitrium patens]